MSAPTLTFLGAAGGTVTGSKHLLEHRGSRLLLDCGLFQGLKALRQRNWSPLSPRPRTLSAVVLSHAHIDHSGYLPRLVRDGFTGPIFCTDGTADLLRIMLPDAAHLQEEEAAFANQHRTSRHDPALPLFTAADAERALARVHRVAFHVPFKPMPGVEARFAPAGHIVGAALVECSLGEQRLVFSGDLGRYGAPIVVDPQRLPDADVLLVESTYGDRLHPPGDPADELAAAVQRAADSSGWLLIPAFAVGRAQEVLFDLRRLEQSARIPSLPVYLDSPLAIQATVIYAVHAEAHKQRVTQAETGGGLPFAPHRFYLSRSVEDSRRLTDTEGPGIILAGSGMATGGRVLHHLRRWLPDPRTTVLFVGYQAAGTRGRLLKDGAQEIRMLGTDVPVRAQIRASDGYSAHADRAQILRWLRGFRRAPSMTWIVHGEAAAAAALRDAIGAELGWIAAVAEDGQRVSL